MLVVLKARGLSETENYTSPVDCREVSGAMIDTPTTLHYTLFGPAKIRQSHSEPVSFSSFFGSRFSVFLLCCLCMPFFILHPVKDNEKT